MTLLLLMLLLLLLLQSSSFKFQVVSKIQWFPIPEVYKFQWSPNSSGFQHCTVTTSTATATANPPLRGLAPLEAKEAAEAGVWRCGGLRCHALCQTCKEHKARSSFTADTLKQGKDRFRCKDCQYPACRHCQQRRPEHLPPCKKAPSAAYFCSERCRQQAAVTVNMQVLG